MTQLRKSGFSKHNVRWFVFAVTLFLVHGIFAQQDTLQWWKKNFIIGMYQDPPQKTGIEGWCADSLWKAALEAKFNLATGIQRIHGNYCDSISPIQHANNHGIRYLFFNNHLLDNPASSILHLDTLLPNSIYSGVHVKDEPKEDQFERVNAILQHFNTDSCHLFFVNLFPYYHYQGNWQGYENYVRLFVNDTVPLQVVCFDNYYPHSEFNTNPEKNKYFSNLAFLRNISGDRPLWSYILTTESRLENASEEWQEAFLRLSAFVPLAYGCKGILYYTFDTLNDGFIYRDFNYRRQPGWEKYLFHPTISEGHEVFFGKMSTSTNGKADMAVKTDANNGTWMVKLAEDTTSAWNHVLHDFGQENATRPFIADWDNDHRYEFMAYVWNSQGTENSKEAHLFVSHPLGGWKPKIALKDLPNDGILPIGRNQAAAGCFHQDNMPVFCMYWPTGNEKGNIRTYLEYNGSAFQKHNDNEVYNFIGFAVEADSVLWAITSTSAYKYDRIKKRWPISMTESTPADTAILETSKIQSYWMEGDTLCVQHKTGIIKEYDVSNNTIVFTHDNMSHSASQLHLKAAYNAATKSYDMYGVPKKEVFGYPSLTDANYKPTKRYDMVKENNTYICKTLAPVVMNSKWLGTWHSTPPKDEVDSLIDIVGENTPLIKSMNEKLLAGMFESSDTLRYLLIVNKKESPIDTCRIALRGNYTGHVTMEPRITTGNTNLTMTFRPDSMDTELKWNDMKGGECVVLRIRPQRPFSHRRCQEDFNGDGRPDISYLHYDSINQKVHLKARYSSEALSTERELAAFPYTLDEEHNSSVWNISARYGEDNLTDVALLDGNAGILYIRNRTSDSLLVDTIHFNLPSATKYVPFSGDVNGDGFMDFSYRTDTDENLRIHLSNNGTLNRDTLTLNLYGNSRSTIPIRGDWDGNGLEDISLYRADHKLLIDYAYHKNNLGLGSWNTVEALDYSFIPKNFKESQLFCRDWDGDGQGDLGLHCPASGKFCIDLGHNGRGDWDLEVSLPQKNNESISQLLCDDWNQDGLDDLIYVYKNEGIVSSISIDLSKNGLHMPDEHYTFQN